MNREKRGEALPRRTTPRPATPDHASHAVALREWTGERLTGQSRARPQLTASREWSGKRLTRETVATGHAPPERTGQRLAIEQRHKI